MDQRLIEFSVMAFLLAITPGADTMLVLKTAISRGKRDGLVSMLGVKTGTLCHALFAAFGISLILVKSAQVFEIVKYAGVVYLLYLGISAIWGAWRMDTKGETQIVADAQDSQLRKSFFEGFLSNILNPKVSVFYLTILPNFIREGDHVLGRSLLLGGIHILFSALWLAGITFAAVMFRRTLSKPRVKQTTQGLLGLTLLGFGLKIALTPSTR